MDNVNLVTENEFVERFSKENPDEDLSDWFVATQALNPVAILEVLTREERFRVLYRIALRRRIPVATLYRAHTNA
jgi:hypothetical protein